MATAITGLEMYLLKINKKPLIDVMLIVFAVMGEMFSFLNFSHIFLYSNCRRDDVCTEHRRQSARNMKGYEEVWEIRPQGCSCPLRVYRNDLTVCAARRLSADER